MTLTEQHWAWTYTFEAKTPDTVRFEQASNSKDTGSFTVAVADATAKEMDAAVEGLFRYWWPEADSRYWRRFQEFRSWYGQANPSPADASARLKALPTDGVRDPTLLQLHRLMGEMFELQTAPRSEEGGISLEPLRKVIQLRRGWNGAS